VTIGGGGEVQVGSGVPAPELAVNEAPIDFNADGSSFFLQRLIGQNAVEIWEQELTTGKRTLLHTVAPPGIALNYSILVTVSRDGKNYAYQYHPALSTLYIIDGLR